MRSRPILAWLWGFSLLALLVGLGWAFRRWVLLAPEGAFTFWRDGRSYRLLEPRTLGVALGLPFLLWVIGRSLADLPWQQRVVSVVTRLAFLLLVALALGRLVRTTDSHKVATIVLVDVSDSVPDESLVDATAAFERLVAARSPDDVVRLVTFARHARLVELPSGDGVARVPRVAELRHPRDPAQPKEAPGAGSNLAAALSLAYGVFPAGHLRRVVLLSDGVQTEGDVLGEANRARSFGVTLYAIPYRRPPPGEVAITSLRAPSRVKIGETFEIVADVYASRATTARAKLYQGETLNGLGGVRALDLEAGVNHVTFKSIVRVGGEVTYALDLDQLGADTFRDNNHHAITLDVPGRPTVLYVEGQPERAGYLTSALNAQEFEVDVRSPSSFPGSAKELERYDFVLVSDVPREAIGEGSQALVEQYVKEGGAFLMAGGASGFGLGGWSHSTFERILPVRMDVQHKKEMPGVAMVLVIDRSGSMSGLPMEMAKAACKATVSALDGEDLIEIIAFDSAPARYVKMQAARSRTRIENDILRIQPGGGTEIFSALDMAYQDVSAVDARKKHVILLTDGRAATQGLRELAQGMFAEGITVTSVGLGEGADQELLGSLAQAGGGRFHSVPDPNSLPKIFTKETQLIARQAAVEEWFPVQQVGAADYLKGISVGSAPPLHGYVATELKPAPAQLILASDRGEPILAQWRVGLGWALAWTSDVKNLWAVDWLRWQDYGRFWGQLVRESMRKQHRRELEMKTELVDGTLRATVDAFKADETFDDGLVSKIVVTGPEPGGKSREVAMRQVAPGRYEASLALDTYGSFVVRAEHARLDAAGVPRPTAVSYGHVSNPYPREYATFAPDLELLSRFAVAGGGSVDPEAHAVLAPGDEKVTVHEQLWSRFVLAAVVLWLVDLLVRRVRIFDRRFVVARRRKA